MLPPGRYVFGRFVAGIVRTAAEPTVWLRIRVSTTMENNSAGLPRVLWIMSTVLWLVAGAMAQTGTVGGELKCWHKVTVTFDGPSTSETATPSPFTQYRLDVIFSGPGGQTYKVPGYYAADGNAGETSATSGTKWRVNFCPDAAGTWTYAASFVQGANIAAALAGGASAGYFDGATGSFVVAASDKPAGGVDFRGKGKLVYVNQHYLQFSGTGGYFLKAGINSPETFLEFNDFDGTSPNLDYAAHVADWNTGDPTWKNGKGKGIIGAINYLSGLGINSVYFITMNAYGDGKKAYPWTGVDNYYQYDCSKLDQWEVVFTQMDAKGLMLHVVLTETENEAYFEVKENGVAGGFADSRKIYYREMVARFGHHMAISWNIGEENGWDGSGLGAGNTDQQRKDFASRLRALAYYKDHIGVHNGPSGNDAIFTPLLGYSDFTGPEIQWNEGSGVHGAIVKWRNASHDNGHYWVVSIDEPYYSGTTPSDDSYRKNEVWGSYMGGGAGVELYAQNDQSLEDFHVNATKYAQSAYAANFVRTNLSFWEMNPDDSLVGSGNDCLAKPGQDYLAYLPNGGTTTLDLSAAPGNYTVRWFDPRNGGALQDGSVLTVTGGSVVALGNALTDNTSDWVALVRKTGSVVVAAGPGQSLRFPQSSSQIVATLNGAVSAGGDSFAATWSQVSGPGTVTFANANALATTATISGAAGSYVLQLSAVAGASTASDTVTITVNAYVPPGVIAADGFQERHRHSACQCLCPHDHAGVRPFPGGQSRKNLRRQLQCGEGVARSRRGGGNQHAEWQHPAECGSGDCHDILCQRAPGRNHVG